MSFKKINQDFCLTDDTVNVYGYRLLTAGFELDRFKPAIGFLMHNRDKGVAVKWEDFRIDGDKLYAKPVVNVSAFPNLAAEIENGFYNGASVGKIVALEISNDEKLMLDGQTGPTVTKWFPREASIVDIPGNYNALAQLYDESDNVLQDLTDKTKQKPSKNEKMSKIEFTVEQLLLLDLKDDATPIQVSVALKELADKAKRADAAEKELKDLKDAVENDKVKAILAQGLTDRKLTKEISDKLEKQYAGKPAELKDLVDAMPAQQLVTATPGELSANFPEKYKGKSYHDLYVSGELEALKADYPDYYETLKNKK